jgi:hypothetical protein
MGRSLAAAVSPDHVIGLARCEDSYALRRRHDAPACRSALLGPAFLLHRGVALVSELGLTAQERKALSAAGLARELLADTLELLEDGSVGDRSSSHGSS